MFSAFFTCYLLALACKSFKCITGLLLDLTDYKYS